MEITFNNTKIFINDWAIDDEDYPTFISSIFVKGVEYNNVTRVTINNGTINTELTYLNKKYGLFYIEDILSTTIFYLNK